MRPHWYALPFLIPALAAAFALAAPQDAPQDIARRVPGDALASRDEHGHGHEHGGHNHHAEPKLVLNETEVLLYHQPTPPSYWSIDFEDGSVDEQRYPGLMGLHILFMSAAFFGALPIGASSPGCSLRISVTETLSRQASRFVP